MGARQPYSTPPRLLKQYRVTVELHEEEDAEFVERLLRNNLDPCTQVRIFALPGAVESIHVETLSQHYRKDD